MSDDEALYALTSKAFFYTQRDVSERWSPLSLAKAPVDAVTQAARVPYILFSPFLGIVNFSMLTTRIPYALFGSIFPLIVFLICKKLFSTKVGLVSASLVAINPWSIQFSRTAYESPIAMYFALLMFLSLLYFKNWKTMITLPLFILSLYSYQGTSVILPIFTSIIVLYVWIVNNKKFTKNYLLFLFLAFCVFAFYFIRLPYEPSNYRAGDFINQDSPTITNQINWDRREAIQTPFAPIFINKYRQIFINFTDKYLGAFSPVYLFSKGGDESAIFSLWFHGRLYLVDSVFLIIGLITMFRYKRKQAILLSALILIAPIPSTIIPSTTQYALRSSLLFPLLLICTGYGIYSTINKFNNKLLSLILIGIIYLISLANFGYIYFIRNPIYNYDSNGISGRIISKYLQIAGDQGYEVQVLSPDGPERGLLRQYIYFSNKYNNQTHSEIAALLTNHLSVKIDNVNFTGCKSMNIKNNSIIIMHSNIKCGQDKLSKYPLNVTDYNNGFPIYLIFNDPVCSKYQVLPYLDNITLNDLNIEKLSNERFCQKFFTRDSGYTASEKRSN